MQAHTLDCYKSCYTYLTLGEIWDLWTGHGLHLTGHHKMYGTLYGQNITGNTALTDCLKRDMLLVDCNVHQHLWTEHPRGCNTSGLDITGNVMGLVTELPTFKRYQSCALSCCMSHEAYSITGRVHVLLVVAEKWAIKDVSTLTLKL